MTAYKTILYATELSDIDEKVVNQITDIVNKYNANLTLVHAVEPLPAYGYPVFVDYESPLIEQAKQEMAKLGNQLNVPAEQQRLEFGSVKSQVLHVAKEINADLIIVASHGRHGIALLLGSSASAIIHGAECDVLVLRSRDKV